MCGMGKRTSVYLSDELHEAWQASGVPLADLVRRGLERSAPHAELDVMRRALVLFGRLVDQLERQQHAADQR